MQVHVEQKPDSRSTRRACENERKRRNAASQTQMKYDAKTTTYIVDMIRRDKKNINIGLKNWRVLSLLWRTEPII